MMKMHTHACAHEVLHNALSGPAISTVMTAKDTNAVPINMALQKELSDDVCHIIAEAYNSGKEYTQISKMLGIACTIV